MGKTLGQSIPDFSAPRQAKAASPVSLIKHRLPFAAALHKLLEYTFRSTFSTPSLLRGSVRMSRRPLPVVPEGWRTRSLAN